MKMHIVNLSVFYDKCVKLKLNIEYWSYIFITDYEEGSLYSNI